MDQPTEDNPYESPTVNGVIEKNLPKETSHYDKILRQAIYWALVQTLIVSVFTSLILDGGGIAKCWFFAACVLWITTLIISLRYKYGRMHLITRWDLILIKYLAWPLFVPLFVLALL